MKKYLVLRPTPAGWYVAAAYGVALLDLAREKAAVLPDSRIIKADTDAVAGATLRRMPAGFELLPDASASAMNPETRTMPNRNAVAESLAADLLEHCRGTAGTDFFAAVIAALSADAAREGLPFASDCLIALEYCRARSAGHYPHLIPGVIVDRVRHRGDDTTLNGAGAGALRLQIAVTRTAEYLRPSPATLPDASASAVPET